MCTWELRGYAVNCRWGRWWVTLAVGVALAGRLPQLEAGWTANSALLRLKGAAAQTSGVSAASVARDLEKRERLSRTTTSSIYRALGLAHEMSGSAERAQTAYEEALNSGIPDPWVQLRLADLKTSAGDHAGAVQHWSEIPDASLLLTERGRRAFEDGQDELAERNLSVALQLDRTNIRASLYLGNLYAAQGCWEKARPQYDLSVENASFRAHDRLARRQLSEALLGRGRATYETTGQTGPVIDDFRQAVTTSPGFIRPYLDACAMLREEQQWSEALGWCMEATQRFPNVANAYYYLGRLYLEWGRWGDAVEQLELALKIDENHTSSALSIAKAYQYSGQICSAARVYQQLRVSGDGASHRLSLAKTCDELEELDSAVLCIHCLTVPDER